MNTEQFAEKYLIELFDLVNPELIPDESIKNLSDEELLEQLLG